jgi:hypothetical protein
MMQQKNLKYLLLLGVAAIWGIILYRVLNGMNDNANNSPASIQKPFFSAKDTSTYEPYELLVDYNDPFDAEESDISLETSTDSLIKATNRFLQNTITKPDLSFIQYKGIIENSTTHKKAAIISINGKDEFVKVNSKLNAIKINVIQKNKIQVTYEGEKFWIKRQ